ncbi:MAG: cyclodeaminase/cyclohydrolase family protein [Candidatus Lustribacter sp.]|jgi:formiminotetrahydrofolate cyclodeaminase
MEFEGYLDALASADPTPGGGSAATLVGALAAALCAMVARITLASPKLGPVHAAAGAVAADADGLRRQFLELRPLDEAAFQAVVAAQALPRATEPQQTERRARLQHALVGAAEAPLEAARRAAEALALVARTAELHNANLMSDVDCALRFARAAFDASVVNVEVNHRFITDAAVVAEQRERLAVLTREAREYESRAAGIIG